MKSMKVILELEKIIPLNIKDGENPELKVDRMIDEMIEIDKKNDGYLSSFKIYEREFENIEESLIFTIVKKAIDSFDPYFVHPDSYDEYDGESGRIAEKIKEGMSMNKIAEIMKEEFNWSFSAKFTREDFFDAAELVFNLLEDCSNKPDINEGKMTRKVYEYVKLSLGKIIPVKILETEDVKAQAVKIVFDEIDSDRKLQSYLSSFNISVAWIREDIY